MQDLQAAFHWLVEHNIFYHDVKENTEWAQQSRNDDQEVAEAVIVETRNLEAEENLEENENEAVSGDPLLDSVFSKVTWVVEDIVTTLTKTNANIKSKTKNIFLNALYE